MRWRSSVFATFVLLAAAGLTDAQPRSLPVSPFGSGYGGPRSRVVIVGSLGNGYFTGPILIPARGWDYPYGIIERHVNIQIVAPVIEPRLSLPSPDLSGIDLDLTPPPWANEFDRPRYVAPPPKPRPKEDVKPVELVKQPPAKVKAPDPEAPRADPIEEGRRLTLLGLTAFRNREYGLAARRFAQAMDIDPAASRTYFFLGQADFALGKYRDAVQMIGLGLGLDPAWPRFPFRPRFDLYLDHPQDWQEHLALLENVQARQPNDVGYVFLLAHQRWFDDQRDDAMKLFRQVRPLVADPALVDLFLKKAP